MSATLWVDTAADETIDFGNTLQFYAAFTALVKLAGKDAAEKYGDLFGIATQVEDQSDAEPEWLASAREQAAEFLHEFDSKIPPPARAILEKLAKKETSEGVDFFMPAAEEIKHVFGKCIDTDSHKTVPCPDAGDDGGKDGNSPAPRPDPAHEKFNKEARAKLSSDIQAMQQTPEGKATLAKGAKLAERVKGGIRAGVEKALAAVDAESKGGISLLADWGEGQGCGSNRGRRGESVQ